MQAEQTGQAPRQTDGHVLWAHKAVEAHQRDKTVQLYRRKLFGWAQPEPIQLGGAYALLDRNQGEQVFAVVHDEA
jgi:hypothetical protein